MNSFLMKVQNFFAGLRDRFARFMYGRYGVDQLYRALFILWIALFFVGFILNAFVDSAIVLLAFDALQMAVVVIMLSRVFSKNLEKRARENVRYLEMTKKLRSWWNLQKRRFRERKTHAFRKCPSCRRTLRLERKKGKHTAHCPLCGHSFPVKF